MKPLWIAVAALIVVALVLRWRRWSNALRALAILAAAAAAVYGTGQVHLPNLETTIEDVGNTLGAWTYVLVGAMTFAETGAFLSFVAPGEFTILFGGVIAGQGTINVVILIGVVWFCAVLGDSTSFWLGRRLGRGFLLRHGARVKITDERLKTVERYYERHGGATVFVGRFVGVLRALGPFIAGASKMSFRRFLPFDILGGGLWGTALVLLGFIFWRNIDSLKKIVSQGFFALGTTIVVVAGAVFAYRYLREAENRAAVGKFLDEQETKPVTGVVVRALRRACERGVVPTARRVARPARFLYDRITPGRLGLELTTLLAIAAVGSFAWIGGALLVGDDPTAIDANALRWGGDIRSDTLVDVSKAVSALGTLPAIAALLVGAAAFLLTRSRPIDAVALPIGFALTYVAVHVTKALVDRPRPTGMLTDASGSSFPSGHAAYATAYVAVAVAVLHAVPGIVRRTLVLTTAIVLALAIGLSRIELRVHYLTDVLGGWGLGACLFAVCGAVALVVAFMRKNAAPA